MHSSLNFASDFKTRSARLLIISLSRPTVFENHRKSLIQHCERSELFLHFEWTKVNKNANNCPFWRDFEDMQLVVKQRYQTCHF